MNLDIKRQEFENWLYLGQTEVEPDDLTEKEVNFMWLAWQGGTVARSQLQMPHMPPGCVVVPIKPTDERHVAALQSQYEIQFQVWRSTDSCMEFWSWDEVDQYDYDQAKPENRRIIQIVKEG